MSNEIKFWKGGNITKMTGNNIFVYGANPEFRNGAGAAKQAREFGAKPYGSGRGIVGNTFGLITKNLKAGFVEEATGIKYEIEGERSVSPEMIGANIDELYQCALDNPEKKFFIAYKNDGKNLNGYTNEDMWDLFNDGKDIPSNIRFHDSFRTLLKPKNTNEQKEEFEFFWKAGSPFSQWHPAPFKYKDKQFVSAEQFMMYSKAKLFADEEVANKIMHFNNALLSKDLINGNIESGGIVNDKKNLDVWSKIQKKFKYLGKEVKGFDEKIWNEKRISIVTVASREKFEQNPDLKNKLLSTDNKTLVEASPHNKLSTNACVVQSLLTIKKHFENSNKENNRSRNRLK